VVVAGDTLVGAGSGPLDLYVLTCPPDRLERRRPQPWALCGARDGVVDGVEADEAAHQYMDALSLANELGMRPLVAHCHLGLGKFYHRTDKRDQAHEHLTTATTMYRDMGMTYWLEKAEAEMRESC
jgi:hypothetical protein